MGIFSFLFGGGKYPTTSKYEAQQEQAKKDYERFCKIASSADLERQKELEAKTTSSDFVSKVDHLKNDRFETTQEYKKEQELKELKKSSDIKGYFKFVNGGKDKALAEALNSQDYKNYKSLKEVVEARGFAEKAAEKDSEESKQLAQFKQLAKSSSVKLVEKTLASAAYANYTQVKSSDRLKKLEALEEYVKTDAFIKTKTYLQDKGRFKKSAEYQELQELVALNKNADLKWYAEKLKANAFADADKWTLCFTEEFDGAKLDAKRWGLGYHAGKKIGGVVYSLADERQKFSESNAVVSNSTLDIQTRAGEVTGTVWDPASLGFVQRKMESTSALITTGDSFKQKYGRFDFKVKVSGVKAPVTANIWLSSDNKTEINVATFGKSAKGITMGTSVNGKPLTGEVTDVKYSNDYYIYSIEWTPKKILWKVNGVEVYSTTSAPSEEMYIGLSSNVVGEGNIGNADLQVEWIKVYQLAQ